MEEDDHGHINEEDGDGDDDHIDEVMEDDHNLSHHDYGNVCYPRMGKTMKGAVR